MTNLEAIAAACARECVRQQVGLQEVEDLICAYRYALVNANRLPTEMDVFTVGMRTEPKKNRTGYRLVPVTFTNGGYALDASAIPSAMRRLSSMLDHDTDPTEFVKAFLEIHPFIDGNGRAAFILFNWLNGTLHDPLPLPDLFEELSS